jgi:hypothetical protein
VEFLQNSLGSAPAGPFIPGFLPPFSHGREGGSLLYLLFSGSYYSLLSIMHAWDLHALGVISLMIRAVHNTRGVPKVGNAVVEIYRIQQFSTPDTQWAA